MYFLLAIFPKMITVKAKLKKELSISFLIFHDLRYPKAN